jgi:hydrogenase maturation factor
MRQPGISVLKEALTAGENVKIHAMHDPTEGGLATALHEIARAAQVGIIVQSEAISIFPETKKLCEHYKIDPMGLIASGALLIVVGAQEANKALTSLKREGITAAIIHSSSSLPNFA